MKVLELITALRMENPDSEVHLAYQISDHLRSTLAPVVGHVGPGTVERSSYHGYKLVPDGPERVVIITDYMSTMEDA